MKSETNNKLDIWIYIYGSVDKHFQIFQPNQISKIHQNCQYSKIFQDKLKFNFLAIKLNKNRLY